MSKNQNGTKIEEVIIATDSFLTFLLVIDYNSKMMKGNSCWSIRLMIVNYRKVNLSLRVNQI